MKVEEMRGERLEAALLGTLDGQPGAISLIHRSIEASQSNSSKLDYLTLQVDTLRFTWAKAMGVVAACSVIFGIILKLYNSH